VRQSETIERLLRGIKGGPGRLNERLGDVEEERDCARVRKDKMGGGCGGVKEKSSSRSLNFTTQYGARLIPSNALLFTIWLLLKV